MDNKNSNGEKTALIITIIVIVFAVLYLLYVIFLSNRDITNNVRNTTNDIKNGVENVTNDIRNGTENLTNDVRNGVNDVNNGINNMTNNVDNRVNNNVGNEAAKATEIVKEEVEISAFTSTIYDKDEGRIFNISLANTKLNDTIVKQGEEFSFIGTVGTMGEAEGYKKTLGFDSNGNKIQIAGGGLCQLSSTLYNAALDAGLEITERHAHSRRVYYVPKDRDATVCYPSLDFKFINNTDGDIKIKVTNDANYVTVNLYKIVEKTKSQ